MGLANRILVGDGCWEWTGSRNQDGYGTYRGTTAHRVVYETLVGTIPEGLELDHVECQNRGCVRPAHVEPVTHAENIRRGHTGRWLPSHCPQGHPYTDENTWKSPKTGWRRCKICKSNQARQSYLRRTRHTV